jgi:hypothetical protein
MTPIPRNCEARPQSKTLEEVSTSIYIRITNTHTDISESIYWHCEYFQKAK